MRGIALACLVALSGGAAHAFDVTSCGLTVPPGQVGLLLADLDCSGVTSGPALQLGERAALRLQGFAIVGAPTQPVVRVAERGTVSLEGPGEIRGGSVGITALRARVLARAGIVVTGNAGAGIDLRDGHLLATDVSISGNDGDGVRANTIDAIDVVADDNGGRGLACTKKMKLMRVSASGNGSVGIAGGRITGSEVTLDDNGLQGAYIVEGKLKAHLLEAIGNGAAGIIGGSVKLRDSTVVDNSLDVDTADIVSDKRPKVADVTCGTSAVRSSQFGASWGVCADD